MSYPQQSPPGGVSPYPQQFQQTQYQQPMPSSMRANRLIGIAVLVLGVFLAIGARLPFIVIKTSSHDSTLLSLKYDADFGANIFNIITRIPEKLPNNLSGRAIAAAIITVCIGLSFGALFLGGAWLLRGVHRYTSALLVGLSGILFFATGLVARIMLTADLQELTKSLGELGEVAGVQDKIDIHIGAGSGVFIIGGVLLLAAAICAIVFVRQDAAAPALAKPTLARVLEYAVAGSFLLLLLPWYTISAGSDDNDRLEIWATGLSRLPRMEVGIESFSMSFSGRSWMLSFIMIAIILAVLLAAHSLSFIKSASWLRWVVAGSGILAALCGLWSLIATFNYRSSIIDGIANVGDSYAAAISDNFSIGLGAWLYFVFLLGIAVLSVMQVLIKSPQEKWEAYLRKTAAQYGGYPPQAGQPGMQQYGSPHLQGQPQQQYQVAPQQQSQLQQQYPAVPQPMQQQPQGQQQPPTYWQP